MHYGIYRRSPRGGCPPCAMRGATLSPDANQDANNGPGTPTRTVPWCSAWIVPKRLAAPYRPALS